MTYRSLAAAAVLAVTMTACGSAESTSETDATEETTPAETTATPVETTPAETTATPEETDDAAASGELTPPGTELAIGEWATVPFDYADTQGVLRVRVTTVDTGSEADFAPFDQDTRNQLKGYTPRYVHLEAEQVSGGDFEYSSYDGNFDPITADGASAQELSAFGSFEPCDSESLPSGFGPGSAAAPSCVIGLVPGGGAEVVGALYKQSGTPYDPVDGAPITWQ